MRLCNGEEKKKANYCDEFPSLTELRRVIPMTFRMSSLHAGSSSSLQPQHHDSRGGGGSQSVSVKDGWKSSRGVCDSPPLWSTGVWSNKDDHVSDLWPEAAAEGTPTSAADDLFNERTYESHFSLQQKNKNMDAEQ